MVNAAEERTIGRAAALADMSFSEYVRRAALLWSTPLINSRRQTKLSEKLRNIAALLHHEGGRQ